MKKMFVKTGDTVQVLSGKSKGVQGEVIAVSPAEGKVSLKALTLLQSMLSLQEWARQADL